jgi:hypothetical protein
MVKEMREDRPRESVAMKVRVWAPAEAGAVQEVEAAVLEEKEPAVEDQA